MHHPMPHPMEECSPTATATTTNTNTNTLLLQPSSCCTGDTHADQLHDDPYWVPTPPHPDTVMQRTHTHAQQQQQLEEEERALSDCSLDDDVLLTRKAVEAKKISPWVAPDHMGHVRTQFTDLMRHTMHTKATTPISALVAWQRKPLLKMLSIHRKKENRYYSSRIYRITLPPAYVRRPKHPSVRMCPRASFLVPGRNIARIDMVKLYGDGDGGGEAPENPTEEQRDVSSHHHRHVPRALQVPAMVDEPPTRATSESHVNHRSTASDRERGDRREDRSPVVHVRGKPGKLLKRFPLS